MAATVTVGCKLPNGLILEVGDKRVAVKGSNSSLLIGGHGITENVDKEFFDTWLTQNVGLQFVKAELIFAHEKATNTAAQAKEQSAEKTGLEPLSQEDKPAGLTEVK